MLYVPGILAIAPFVGLQCVIFAFSGHTQYVEGYCVLGLLFVVPYFGLQCVIVAFPGHTRIHFDKQSRALDFFFLICIGYSMFCVGYGIYTRKRSSRVYISYTTQNIV